VASLILAAALGVGVYFLVSGFITTHPPPATMPLYLIKTGLVVWFRMDQPVSPAALSSALLQAGIAVNRELDTNWRTDFSSFDHQIWMQYSNHNALQRVLTINNATSLTNVPPVLYYLVQNPDQSWTQFCASGVDLLYCGRTDLTSTQVADVDIEAGGICRLGRLSMPTCDQCLPGFYLNPQADPRFIDCRQCPSGGSTIPECSI
jgi:hypothetical protein